jgi:DNA-binding response OmpR family regulator
MPPKILVVDDNADSVAILKGFLEARGYIVVTAANGVEALENMQREGFDLVLLDVMMPGMNGFDVLAEMPRHEATARLPVILLTAKTQDEDLMKGYELGADYYITKPFTSRQLFYGVDLILGKADEVG